MTKGLAQNCSQTELDKQNGFSEWRRRTDVGRALVQPGETLGAGDGLTGEG